MINTNLELPRNCVVFLANKYGRPLYGVNLNRVSSRPVWKTVQLRGIYCADRYDVLLKHISIYHIHL